MTTYIIIAAVVVFVACIVFKSCANRCKCGEQIPRDSVCMHHCSYYGCYVFHDRGKQLDMTTQSESHAHKIYAHLIR